MSVTCQVLVGLKTKRYIDLVGDIRVRALCYVTLLAREALVEINSSRENFRAPSRCIMVMLPTD